MDTTLRFEPVTARNRRDFFRITRELLWCPVWPGDAAAERDFDRAPALMRQGARLIYDGSRLVGRVIAAQIDAWLIVRDLGLRDTPGLAERVAGALLAMARRQKVEYIRAGVHEPYWAALAARGFLEQKRRMTMRHDLRALQPISPMSNARPVRPADRAALGRLLRDAYADTVDDEGEDLAIWAAHVSDIQRGQFGPFLPVMSFVTPVEPPLSSATLVVEGAPGCAVLGQVATLPELSSRGLARRLIGCSLAALAGANYHTCFLEVTLSNDNAVHLYRSLGFQPVGPQIVYGVYSFP
jgi:ribosomal protein S18 acetylase RimI-like enzyme